MAELKIEPPGKRRAITDIGLRFEAERAAIAIVLPHTHVMRTQDLAVLEDLAARLTASAATLRRYNEQGEVPLIGGGWDPHHPDWWWQD